jgi:arsenate reductase
MGETALNEVVILHNPRCSKSRATLELLSGRGIKPRVVDYLDNPPTAAELERILDMLGMTPRELMRRGEEEYKALGLHDDSLSHDELLAALCAHPRLIERPIVVANGKAVIGRPPESVLDIL